MDVMLIIPPVSSNSLLAIKWENHFEFLGPEYILAFLRKNSMSGCIVDAENLNLSVDQILEIVRKVKPRIIGFSVSKSQIMPALQIVKKIRESGLQQIMLLFGGYYPTLSPERMLEQVDEKSVVIIGEGEHVFSRLAKAIIEGRDFSDIKGIAYKHKEKIIVNEMSELESNLDDLPFPCRDTLGDVMSIGGDPYLVSSRGCYANCSFCSIKAFYRQGIGEKYRIRSVANIVDEVEYLIRNYDITSYRIFDDNLFAGGDQGKQRVSNFVNELEKRNIIVDFEIVCRANDVEDELFARLKAVGLTRVVIGLESFNQRSLNYYGKNLKVDDNKKALAILDKYGIECVGSYIMFNPKSSFEEIEQDYNYFRSRLTQEKGINQLNSILASSTILSIDEGTNLYFVNKKKENETVGDSYQLENRLVDKLKNIGVYLTIALKDNILKLVWLDKYFRKQVHDGEARKDSMNELDKLWYELASINLNSFEYFLDALRKCNDVSEIDYEAIKKKVSEIIDRIIVNSNDIDSFTNANDIKFNCLPRIWVYTYYENEKYHFLDLITKKWYEGDKLKCLVIKYINLNYEMEFIVEKLKCHYQSDEIKDSYRQVLNEFNTNCLTKKVNFKKVNKRYLEHLFTCIFRN